MDTYRGNIVDSGEAEPDYNYADDEVGNEPPPSPVGQDERRMQVRAYNHWAGLLDNRNFPSIEDLDVANLPDFGPYSVLLDFTAGVENPSIQFLGDKLAAECGTNHEIEALSDVPSRSLLSRITDHYMQILANQAPIGFEAEFVNQRDLTILYRGILLPFSSDDDTIDFIYGVINWKELADQQTANNLLVEIGQALDAAPVQDTRRDEPLTDWADGPSDIHDAVTEAGDDVLDLTIEDDGVLDLTIEDDGVLDLALEGAAVEVEADFSGPGFDLLDASAAPEPVAALDAEGMGLADWLASARELAEAAHGSEDRTRHALYAAIGRAYDFAIAAAEAPEEFVELVQESGLTVQDRAPMTPVVKLVFGADYDKTRLTEYASALGHAQRVGLAQGALAGYLATAPGGLKGVVAQERQLKRGETVKELVVRDSPRKTLARKLRKLEHQPLDAVAAEGSEFTLLVARRLPSGEVVLLGEVADDIQLLERAARRLVG